MSPVKKKKTKEKPKKKATASLRLPRSPLKDFECPNVAIATKINAEGPQYLPSYATERSSTATIVARVLPDITGDKKLMLTHRVTLEIDCGFSMELPPGYRFAIDPIPRLANKGLMLRESNGGKNGNVSVVVTNVGKEIIVVRDGDVIGEMAILSVYRFEVMGV